MEEGTAAQYSKALRMQLADAGLQGSIQSDAFKLLVQYMTNEQADQQIMALILEQLKQGKLWVEPSALGVSVAASMCWEVVLVGFCSTGAATGLQQQHPHHQTMLSHLNDHTQHSLHSNFQLHLSNSSVGEL